MDRKGCYEVTQLQAAKFGCLLMQPPFFFFGGGVDLLDTCYT